MTIRQLPEDEWNRLLALDDDWLQRIPDSGTAAIFVEEDDLGDIVGYWMVLQTFHLEPMWVRPDHRGGLIVSRLWKAMRHFLDTCSIKKAFCMSEIIDVQGYLRRLGFQELPDKVYMYEAPCPKTH